jgi:hypothetical protein
LSSPPEKEKTGGSATGAKTKEEKKPIPILPPNTTSADKKAAKNDLDDVRKTYETTMKRGACEDKVVENSSTKDFWKGRCGRKSSRRRVKVNIQTRIPR